MQCTRRFHPGGIAANRRLGFFLHCTNIKKQSAYTIANKFGNSKNYSYLCTKKR